MEIIRYPEKETWPEILRRPVWDFSTIESKVSPIMKNVRDEGDTALKKYTAEFDGVVLDNLMVKDDEFRQAAGEVNTELKTAIELAARNISIFHEAQREDVRQIMTSRGVMCWRKSVPIEKVGLYVPGGSAPLVSTVLMLGIPAKIAGCSDIVLCTPPDKRGNIHPAILFTAEFLGIEKVFKIGGAQAIAAMAYGTATVPAVDKIFGPGNQYVTAAKQLAAKEGIAVDLPAGPSEVAVVADRSADADFVAADLLSQAEHGADSQVLLVSDSLPLVKKVQQAVEKQLAKLPRKAIAASALKNSRIIIVHNTVEAMEIINAYAPEHLILMVDDPKALATKVVNAGSVFLGNLTPESAGDYASGTNHTLPTNGFARAYSGVSLDSFVKKITFQNIDEHGLRLIGPAIEALAREEGLEAHRQAVRMRLKKIGVKHD